MMDRGDGSFPAQFHGTCTNCEQLINPGELIRSDGEDRWRHKICQRIAMPRITSDEIDASREARRARREARRNR